MLNVHSQGLTPCTEKQSIKTVLWLFTGPIERKPCCLALIADFSAPARRLGGSGESAKAKAGTLKLDGLSPRNS